MSEQELVEASPCKLRNGDWGCRTTAAVQVGDTVRIVTRANKQWRAEITQIVWTNDETWICETASENSRGAAKPKAASTSGHSADAAPKSERPPVADEHEPAAPLRTDVAGAAELDAMADAAAAREDDFDALMSAAAEFENGDRR
ncbi:hypothetical protein T31B1_09673 [Salinisphaera sp. T31B1]